MLLTAGLFMQIAPSDSRLVLTANTDLAIRSVAGEQPTAQLSPEVRLRKLHLVRPDLIPYPIQLEVYC
jgi:hypothetical protein